MSQYSMEDIEALLSNGLLVDMEVVSNILQITLASYSMYTVIQYPHLYIYCDSKDRLCLHASQEGKKLVFSFTLQKNQHQCFSTVSQDTTSEEISLYVRRKITFIDYSLTNTHWRLKCRSLLIKKQIKLFFFFLSCFSGEMSMRRPKQLTAAEHPEQENITHN